MTAGQSTPALMIYTDASFSKAEGRRVGSWGAVFVWGEGDHEIHSGQFRTECPNSTVAEFYAIANALARARAHPRLEPSQGVHVLTDCQTVVSIWHRKVMRRATTRETFGEAMSETRRQLALLARPLQLEWVKGHQATDSTCPHAPFNRMADFAAAQANGVVARKRERAQAARKRKRERERAARKRAREEGLNHGS